ncbi:MAG: hypothetical protein NTU43_02145 [Bacteroidetes bacterium]|nr:hypothetical protein [Bacteroidota bacterium]
MDKQLQKLIMLLLTFTVIQARAQVSITATAGSSSGAYSNLINAFADINNGTYQGAIDIRISSSFSSSASAVLNASGTGSASYTSVLIGPDPSVVSNVQVSTTTANINLIDLSGADNVTIDGRVGGTGSTSMLEFLYNVNTTLTSTNTTMRINNGATNNEFKYVKFSNNSIQSASGAANINIINTSAGFGPNNNITISNCTFYGARNSIIQDGTNNLSGATTDNLIIKKNVIYDFALAGVNLGINIGSVTIDSNTFYHSSGYASNYTTTAGAATAQSPRAIYVGSATATTKLTANITKNRIYDLKATTTGSSIFCMVLNMTTNTQGNVINVYNNSISLMQTNANVNAAYTGGCNGIITQGNNSGTYNIYNNTVRIGGTSSGSTSTSVRGYCLMVINNSASITANVKNNLFINTRTGGTTLGASNYYLAAIYYYTLPTYNVDNNVYYGSPYYLGIASAAGGITITTAIPWLTNDASSLVKTPTFSGTQQPYLSGASLADADLSAPRISTVLADIDNNTRSATCYKGAYEATASPFITNDLQARIIYTYGKIPVGTLDSIRVRVKSNGISALTNSLITVTIKGANTATLTYNIATIGALADLTYTFPGYTPLNLGYDTITAAVPTGDQNTTNDTITWIRENTLNALSYTKPFLGRTGNLGTNPQGELMAKFSTPVDNFVNQVNVDFTSFGFSAQSFSVVIYEDSGSTYGPKMNALWVSSPQTTVNGIYNLAVPSVAIRSGSFYVGVRQLTSNNIGFAYQNENPIRTGTFYFRQGATYNALPWNDFAVNVNNQFRFMIEPRLKINNDLGVTDLVSPGLCSGSASTTYSVNVQNLGLLTQDFAVNPLSVYGTVTDPSSVTTSFGPIVINSDTLHTDGNLVVALTNTYDMSAAGTYTFKAWTVSGADNNAINDTLLNVTRTAVVPVSAPHVQDFNASTAMPSGWSTANFRFNGSTGTGVSGSNSMRALILSTSTYNANAVLSSPRITGATASSVLRFKYKATNYVDGSPTAMQLVDSIKVLISSDCGTSYSYAHVITGANHTTSSDYTSVSINLAGYVGGGNDLLVHFVLDWFGTSNNAYVDIDDIRFIDASSDVSPTNLGALCAQLPLGASISPTVDISNLGISSASNVSYGISIAGPNTFSNAGTASSISASSSNAVTFATFTPSVVGTYTVKVYSNYTGDNDMYNDTLYTTFTVFAGVTNFAATTNLATDSFTINWTANANATSYNIDVATDAAFTSMVSGYNNLSVNATSQNVSGLSSGIKYYFRLRTTNSCGTSINSSTDSATTLTSSTPLTITAYLQGSYIGAGTMNSTLFLSDGVSPTNIADTITIELHDAVTPSTLSFSAVGTLGTNGVANISLPALASGNSYYIVIKHRNSIATCSAVPVLLNNTSNSYNFSSAASQAYGDNMIDDGTGKFMIYAGDINQDGEINFADYPFLNIAESNGVLGYDTSDISGDGAVDFADYPIININESNGVLSQMP